MKNEDILKDLKIEENWLINNILQRKMKYFGHIKRQKWFGKNNNGGHGSRKTRKGKTKTKMASRHQRHIEHDNGRSGRSG